MDLRKLIEMLKNIGSELSSAAKDGTERCASFKKLIEHMVRVIQCIQNSCTFGQLRRNTQQLAQHLVHRIGGFGGNYRGRGGGTEGVFAIFTNAAKKQ